MRTLVTGASGAIGSWLAKKLLSDGHEVVSILHDNRPFTTSKFLGIHDKISWAHGSILDGNFVKRVISDYSVDTIYHLAALPLVQVSTRTAVPVFDVNIMGTVNILEAIKENYWTGKEIALVVISTDKAYGDAGEKPYTEDLPLGGLSIYDVSKACADMITRTYAAGGFAPQIVVARPCNVIIPGDTNLGRVFPRTTLPALSGKNPILYRTYYVREFIWIEDIVSGLVTLGKSLKEIPEKVHGEAFNIGSGNQATLEIVVGEILNHFSGISPVWIEPPTLARVEIPYQKLNTTKMETTTGWTASTSFRDSVHKYIDW